MIGAHAGGFNTGSVGVAVIGIYDSATLSTAARAALQNLLAWRLDVGHVYPRGQYTAVSAGSSKWAAGAHVRLRAVSGHRDTDLTSCPGDTIYGLLSSIARRVTSIGLPKLWSPEAEGAVGGPVRFTARLSAARPVDGRGQGRRRHGRGPGQRERHRGRLDLGRERRADRLLHLHDQLRGRRAALDAPRARAAAARGHRPQGRAARADAERRRRGEVGTIAFGLTTARRARGAGR